MEDMFVDYKSGFWVQFRIIFFTEIICIAICFFLQDEYAPYSLIPALLFQHFICRKLNLILIFQEKFSDQIYDKSGQPLCMYLRDNYDFVEKLNFQITYNQYMLLFFSIVACIFLVIAGIFKITTLFSIFSAVFYFLSVFGLIVYFNLISNETYYAFLGFNDVHFHKQSVLQSAFIVLGICAVFGFIFSSNEALIKIRQTETIEYDVNYEKEDYYQDKDFKMPEPEKIDKQFNNIKPLINWEIIQQICKVIFIVLLIGLSLYLLVVYVFTTKFITFFKEHTLFKIFTTVLCKIRDFIFELFNFSKKKNDPYATITSYNFKRNIDKFLKNLHKSDKKKTELDRLTKKFMKLIDWGYTKNVKYKNTMAPAEYTDLLVPFFEKISLSGKLYEKALYSDELLTNEEEKNFSTIIEEALRS